MESGKQTGDEDGDGDDSDDGGCGVEGAGGEGGGGESSNVEDEVIAGNVPGNPSETQKISQTSWCRAGQGRGRRGTAPRSTASPRSGAERSVDA